MISVLVPSRGRPFMLLNSIKSSVKTANNPYDVEFIVRLDTDDPMFTRYSLLSLEKNVRLIVGARANLSKCYMYQNAHGPIYMMGGDDIIFRTQGWDTKVREGFDKYPDKIVLVYGRDGDPSHTNYATMPFVHKNWIEAVGRYLPPYFSGDFTDTWLNELADGVGRKEKVDIYIEHIHPAFNKREQDQTDKDKWEKHFRDDMPKKFKDTRPEREKEIEKLKSFIKNFYG